MNKIAVRHRPELAQATPVEHKETWSESHCHSTGGSVNSKSTVQKRTKKTECGATAVTKILVNTDLNPTRLIPDGLEGSLAGSPLNR